MIQSGCGARFPLETAEPLFVAGIFVAEELDGDAAAEARVAGAVDFAHAPFPRDARISYGPSLVEGASDIAVTFWTSITKRANAAAAGSWRPSTHRLRRVWRHLVRVTRFASVQALRGLARHNATGVRAPRDHPTQEVER
jgi:hypothetical protein